MVDWSALRDVHGSATDIPALPFLAEIAAGGPDVAIDAALFLYAAILAAEDDAAASDGRLTAVAEAKLALLSARRDVLYALGTVAALDGVPLWAQHLEALAGEEVEPTCPGCGE